MNTVFLNVDSLMCQSLNLSWEMAVQNAGCVFAYFCGWHKINLRCNFVAPLNISIKVSAATKSM